MRSLTLFTLAIAALATGCIHPADQVRRQAAFEMNCPAEKLETVPLSGDCSDMLGSDYQCTMGVRGCDRQMSYLHVPGGDTWVVNTASAAPQNPAAALPGR